MSEQNHTQLATLRQSQLSRGIDVLRLPFDQLWSFCTAIARTDVGKGFKNDPATVLIGMQFGAELGLHWAQSLSSIMVPNGRASIYGDSMLGLCKTHPDWNEKVFKEVLTGEGKNRVAHCQVGRGENIYQQSYTWSDAEAAKLTTKSGPWQECPNRMLKMRARSWALRDAFPDVLKGLLEASEASDVVSDGPAPQNAATSLASSVRASIPQAEVVETTVEAEAVTA